MIRYALKCSHQHQFESWFRSAEDFDTLNAQGQVSCPQCGETNVTKAIMAPQVRTKDAAQSPQETEETTSAPAAPAPSEPTPEQIEQAISQMRAEVEANSDYVGMNFASEARKMHEGETPNRAIYGEAKLDEAKALLEDGIPVLPLPFTPKRKMN
ncbi:DUF1178 family protein [Celeribacter litoreus]|uniref:DUF1178 family protein n=1 Tax=Celeribacter litoreus TaxID=2876714 RepID=UPI001CCAC659|nr:DUF1178 family protein [Celeribacter litoreus]MCA0044087.1 DUF1178 family protein [Celeribacter litoreus]